jgi:hypothetical protein
MFKRHHFLIQITFLFWFIGKIMSYKLWVADRIFPLIPPFNFLLQLPSFVHTVLFISSMFLMLLIFIRPNQKTLILFFIIEMCSCFLDQNRWQPWEYQYIISVLIFIIHFKDKQKIAHWILLIGAVTYFYSGLQKMQEGFICSVWQDAFLHKFFKIPTHICNNVYVKNAGYSLALLEIIAGICLVFKIYLKHTIIFLITMHLLILIIIGPWALHFNDIVWPWNALMIIYLIQLLITNSYINFCVKQIFIKQTFAVAIVWCFFPLLNFIGLWDYFMSCSLYSGRIPLMEICVKENLPNELTYFFHLKKKPKRCLSCAEGINIQTWGMKEILVPPLPQERVYEKIKIAIEKKYPNLKADFYIFYLPREKNRWRKL